MALREPINFIIEEKNLDADVAAKHVNGVIAADGKGIAVAGGHPNFQVGPDGFEASGYCGGAAVNRVESVSVHVIREAAGAANAGDDNEIFFLNAELGENGLDRGENGVVAAPRAPAHFLVGLKILFRERRRQSCGAHDRLS